MIKDAKGRFPGNDLWGDGWGWALFEAKDPKKNVATDYTTDCKFRTPDMGSSRGERFLAIDGQADM